MHGMHRSAKLLAAPCLHLNERDQLTALHDEIEVAMSATKAMCHEGPACAQQIAGGDAFAE